ncbi:GxxExxY protein [Thiohalobacter sp. IOR34]|uniref:GxxExxY protein n=1 Tax=Thiohalobacter sp. IOR34 TaxID=3057176 RepID=UPI0025B19CAF|nr:GxxExxY protein [Thiohalobacter sp. IOR34]WJW75193.1 GxxExxY protein [Thiohalobacter sp. IOR34]
MLVERDLTYKVRSCVYEVYRVLGAGYLEKVYEKALIREFEVRGIRAQAQVPLKVSYKGREVGEYYVDILVEGRILIELKAQDNLMPVHEAQLLNYLKVSGRQIGLLINFTYPRAVIKRMVV